MTSPVIREGLRGSKLTWDVRTFQEARKCLGETETLACLKAFKSSDTVLWRYRCKRWAVEVFMGRFSACSNALRINRSVVSVSQSSGERTEP